MEQHTLVTIAGLTVDFAHTYDYLRLLCRAYIAAPDTPADLSVRTTPEQIRTECRNAETDLPPEYAESLCLFRALAEQFPLAGRAVFHGAAVEYRGKGYLFTAPSGTGKSTHISLWRRVIGEEVRIINGDKPALRLTEDGVDVCSTPWAGKENWQRNTSAPLGALCLLERGTVDGIRRVDPSQVIERLMSQIYLPRDPAAAVATLDLMDALIARVPVFLLSCTPTARAVEVAFPALTGCSDVL